MNSAAPLYPPKATPNPEPQGTDAAAPRPVMSAKAAINAMYSAEKNSSNAKLIPSAREAVNAASRLAPKNFKSAATLHHGSLQKVQKIQQPAKSLESTRTSASALLKTASSASKDVPVVHTSLKIGANANAQPKSGAVVLPAGSRMAESARPIVNLSDVNPGATALANRSTSARRISSPNNGLAVKVITSGTPKLAAPRPRRTIRDPQMLSGGRRVLSANNTIGLPAQSTVKAPNTSAKPLNASIPVQTVPVTSNGAASPANQSSTRKLVRPRRFRTAPKNYAETQPSPITTDTSYAISEPPKLAARRRSSPAPADLGVVKTFRPSKLPEPIGDAAPIGRLAEQRVASGHGGPAETPTIKAENTSNYSFSRRNDKSPQPAPRAPLGKSPFLKSVTVEKRPLSDSSVPTPISLPYAAEPRPEKTSRKNSYQKKADAKAELPTRPTVIVPSSRRSKAPLFFLILFTIILGAAVGAAVYLCFFQ